MVNLIPTCAISDDKKCDVNEDVKRIEFFSDKQIALITNHYHYIIEDGTPRVEQVSKLQWLSIGLDHPNTEVVIIDRMQFNKPELEFLKLLGFPEEEMLYIHVDPA